MAIIATSSFLEYETENRPKEPKFLNGAIKLITKHDPQDLLQKLEDIETKLGREFKGAYQPRTIDLDILLYEEDIVLEDNLTIPHPLMHERIFVMEPLNEIAPEAYHPMIGNNVASIYRAQKEGRDL
jgi:2-amino-4-hydroxy-6-hydroxymethyldihydropteridine diphosphokinase